MRDSTPWSDETVARLNAHQKDRSAHPFTCPGDHDECKNQRELVATENGWVCQCGKYTQDWAHAFMLGKTDETP